MTDFKGGGIPVPDYDKEDINFVSQKTEFTDDVFVYGKLYAEFGGDVQTFSTGGKERLRIDSNGILNLSQGSTDNFLILNNGTQDIVSVGNTAGNLLINIDSNTQETNPSIRMSVNDAEKLRIDRYGDATIQSGDFIIGSTSGGFSFVNSSSTPDADSTSSTRVIKDYDEGTCDWELHRSDGLTTGNPGTNSIVTYTKIGNRVFMSGYVRTHTTGSSTGVTARLTDASGNAASLPYTPNHSGGMPISHTRTIDEFERMSVSFASGSKTVYVHTDESNNDYTPNQNDVTISSTQTHLVIAFTGSYTTDE